MNTRRFLYTLPNIHVHSKGLDLALIKIINVF